MNSKTLSLSSGAHMGIFNLGAVSELENQGLEFDELYGVSIGAIIIGLLSIGMTSEEIGKEFFDNIYRLKDIWSFKTLDATPLYNRIKFLTGERKLGNTNKHVHIGVTQKETNKKIILSSEITPHIELSKAIFASALLKVMRGPTHEIGSFGNCIDGGYSQRLLEVVNKRPSDVIYIDCGVFEVNNENTIHLTKKAQEIKGNIGMLVQKLLPWKFYEIPTQVSITMKRERELLFQEGINSAKEFTKKVELR